MLTCKKASGVASPKDFKGKTLGVWFGGNEYPFLNWMAKLGLKPDTDIKILKQGFNVDPLLQNQAACISTMIYNEYWQVVDAGVKESDLVTFFYEKEGVATLEDGLYVLEAKLKDPAFVARMGKFLKATLQGLERRGEDPAGAPRSWWQPTPSGSATLKVQKRQMENVAKLITNAGTAKIGYLEPAAYERTVKVLLAGGSSPVIKKDPGKAACPMRCGKLRQVRRPGGAPSGPAKPDRRPLAAPMRTIWTGNKGLIRQANEAAFSARAKRCLPAPASLAPPWRPLPTSQGLPKANLHYYFGSKADLYRAVLARTLRDWLVPLDALVPEADPAQALATYIRAKMAMSAQRPDASRVFANELLHGAPVVGALMRGELRDKVQLKAAVIDGWVTAGRMAPVDATHLFFTIWAATQTYADFEAQVCAVLGRDQLTAARPCPRHRACGGSMNTVKLIAIVLMVVGLLGASYGGFSYTKQTHEANIGR
jgi:AcrR family transcriptional regulator